MSQDQRERDMHAIEQAAKEHAEARNTLENRVTQYRDHITTIQRRRLPGIKSAAAEVATTAAKLRQAINNARYLFSKPKTIILGRLKVGLQKQKGAISIPDEAKTIALIEKQLPMEADALINTTKKVNKAAVANLDAKKLRAIGVSITEAGDAPLIKDTASDAEKIAAKIIKDTADLEA